MTAIRLTLLAKTVTHWRRFGVVFGAKSDARMRQVAHSLREFAETAIGIARVHHMPQWLTQAPICRGFALVGPGLQAEGIAQLRAGLAD